MMKNNYLSKEEQIIFNTINKTDIIDHEQIKDLFPSYPSTKINKICHNLLSKGYLYPVKRGIYIINDKPSDKPMIKNPYTIASYLNKGYLGFSSALHLYDLIDYEPFTIFMVSNQTSSELTIGTYLFKTVAFGKKATGSTFYKNVYVSTIEKTIFDCFYKPQYAGGYQELINTLSKIKSIDWNQVLFYFNHFASNALFQRTGYILTILHKNNTISIPKYFFHEFKKHVKSTTKLIPTAPSKGTYNKEWKVLNNLGKEIIMER